MACLGNTTFFILSPHGFVVREWEQMDNQLLHGFDNFDKEPLESLHGWPLIVLALDPYHIVDSTQDINHRPHEPFQEVDHLQL